MNNTKLGQRWMWNKQGSRYIIEIIINGFVGKQGRVIQKIDNGAVFSVGQIILPSIGIQEEWLLLMGQESPL
jgi:hypothetical protein